MSDHDNCSQDGGVVHELVASKRGGSTYRTMEDFPTLGAPTSTMVGTSKSISGTRLSAF